LNEHRHKLLAGCATAARGATDVDVTPPRRGARHRTNHLCSDGTH
jgi:hypothetical protein